jgi:hypothetical protein
MKTGTNLGYYCSYAGHRRRLDSGRGRHSLTAPPPQALSLPQKLASAAAAITQYKFTRLSVKF